MRPVAISWGTLAFVALLFGCADRDAEDGHGKDGHGEHAEDEGHGEDDGAGHAGAVHLDPHVIERNGIETSTAEKRLLLGALELPAEVQMNPDRTAHVASLAPGRLEKISAALGDRVERGDPLAVVRSAEIGRARADLATARAHKQAADAELDRATVLTGEGIAAKKRVTEARARVKAAAAEVRAARASLAVYGGHGGSGPELVLNSPIEGTVIERHASPGEVVGTTNSPFVIADLREVWVIGRVYEQELSQVSEGMAAEVALIAYPGRTWPGDVDYVSDTLDEDTRTASVRVVLKNEDGVLRPGLFGTIAIGAGGPQARGEAAKVLSVPDTALATLGDRTVVFVAGDEVGSFVARDVVPGRRAHGLVEIREGLSAGEPVVTGGVFVLKSEVLKGSIGEGHSH